MGIHSETVGRLVPAPRAVPLSLRVVNRFGGLAQVGFFLLAFSTPFFWLMGVQADLPWLTFRGEMVKVGARITAVERTGASQNRQQIYAHHYSFVAGGQDIAGVSYSNETQFSVNDAATVEYDPADPARSRLEGMRQRLFSTGVLAVLIFPAIGIPFVYFSLRQGGRTNELLEQGIATFGKLRERRPTGIRVNNRPVWELVFSYAILDGTRHEASTRTSFTDTLTDDAKEPLLYHPQRPEKAVFLDSFGSRLELDETGGWRGRGVAAALVLILPMLVLVANLLLAVHYWKR